MDLGLVLVEVVEVVEVEVGCLQVAVGVASKASSQVMMMLCRSTACSCPTPWRR